MKRWMIYLLLIAGLHIFYFYSSKISIQSYIEQTKEMYSSPTITNPNWSNPIKDDIFIVMDTSSAINYYKIVDDSNWDSITLLPGKFTIQSKNEKGIYDGRWTHDFVNSNLLYGDTFQRYSLDDFNSLKKGAQQTHGFRVSSPKNKWGIYFFQLVPYQLLLQSLLAFFIIWLFVYLSAYLTAITSFSKQQIIIFLTILCAVICIEVLGLFMAMSGMRIPVYSKIIAFVLLLIPGLKYLKNSILNQLDFFDKEAGTFIFIFVIGFALSCLGAFIQCKGVAYFSEALDQTYLGSLGSSSWQFHIFPFSLPTFLAIATGNFLNNFRIHFFNLRKEAKALALAKENELKFQTQIESLQAKINPHFLYNSLNSIASLAQEDPAKTEKMAIALSSFYKDTTNRHDQHLITVEEEMNQLHTYLEIEKIRFGDRLEVVFDYDKNMKTQEVPRFLLQPLVENAIKYGYNAEENKTYVKIEATKSENKLVFKIIDHGPDFPDDLATGYGLRSVQKKLKLFYPDKHQLAFINQPNKQVFIEITL